MLAVEKTPIGRPRGALNVLVVDSSADVRALHARCLGASGLKVFTAGNGARALDTIRHTVPDLVVMDLDQPLMDGLTFYQGLRSDSATEHVPVVVVTSDATRQGGAAFHSACDVVLRKPCSQDLLLATVKLLLDRPRAAAHSAGPLSAGVNRAA